VLLPKGILAMRKWIALAVLLLVPCVATAEIKVRVAPGSGEDSQAVADKFKGKVGASSRYALVTHDPVILVSVSCLATRAGGVACYFIPEYFPGNGWTTLKAGMAIGTRDSVAGDLFDMFVEASTTEELTSAFSMIEGLRSKTWQEGWAEGAKTGAATCPPKK
jgi:hypothetical protein